ncbi:MAG: chloride channel protein [Candidatus Omnitrophica bacterium]|nr:chloride channel protein [Candidatus Omnitrophota bacterium]
MLFPFLFASIVGVGAGFLSVVLIQCIHFSEHFFFDEVKPFFENFLNGYSLVIIPAIGGLLVGLIIYCLAPETKGHGVPEVMKAVAIRGGRIRPVVMLVKTIASSLSIGSGASVGREGPAVQIGATFGSSLAQLFKLNAAQTKNLVACGSAAGIAAVFNAPLAGVMFSLEVIMRDFGARSLSTVVVSALAGSIVSRSLLGNHPAFMVPVYKLHSPFEIGLYLLLGIVSAFVALLFIHTLDKSEEWTAHKTKIYPWLKPALGGLAVGVIGLIAPDVLGSGFTTIEHALTNQMTLQLLAALVLLKIIATSVSLGTGSSGGTFAPTLFVGAVLGGAFGRLFYTHCPFPVAPPGAYALAGMASVFAGATHAPVTAILLIFELTEDYKLILPIMAAVVASTVLTQILSQESIDTVNLKRMGIDVRLLQETKFLSALRVGDAMTQNFEFVPQSMPAEDLIRRMTAEKDKVFFVNDAQNECVGFITIDVMKDVLFEKEVSMIIVDDLVTPIQEAVMPEDSLSEAANLMTQANVKYLPVMDPADPKKIVGVIKREDFHHAFTHITLKQAELLNRLERESAQAGGIRQFSFTLPSRSLLKGTSLKTLDLPKGVVFTSIERHKEAVIPTGETILQSKDRVWVGVTKQYEQNFREWVKANHLTIH